MLQKQMFLFLDLGTFTVGSFHNPVTITMSTYYLILTHDCTMFGLVPKHLLCIFWRPITQNFLAETLTIIFPINVVKLSQQKIEYCLKHLTLFILVNFIFLFHILAKKTFCLLSTENTF